MAAITHAGFRTLVDEFGGCDLYFSEMISAEALNNGSPYEAAYLDGAPDPSRLVYQVVGYSQDAIVDAAQRIADYPSLGIDINMGCSAPAVAKRGGGVAWTASVDRARRLVAAVRSIITDRSLSVKLRLGSTESTEHLLALVSGLAEEGLDFVTVHPKTARDGPARPARWHHIRALTSDVSIPVIGNGGITDRQSLNRRRRNGETAASMIGRAAVRAPWVFATLTQQAAPTVDLRTVAERFHELLERHQPRDFWTTRARRFYPYFFGNLAFGHSMGARLGNTRDYDQIKREALDYLSNRVAEPYPA